MRSTGSPPARADLGRAAASTTPSSSRARPTTVVYTRHQAVGPRPGLAARWRRPAPSSGTLRGRSLPAAGRPARRPGRARPTGRRTTSCRGWSATSARVGVGAGRSAGAGLGPAVRGPRSACRSAGCSAGSRRRDRRRAATRRPRWTVRRCPDRQRLTAVRRAGLAHVGQRCGRGSALGDAAPPPTPPTAACVPASQPASQATVTPTSSGPPATSRGRHWRAGRDRERGHERSAETRRPLRLQRSDRFGRVDARRHPRSISAYAARAARSRDSTTSWRAPSMAT